MSDNVLPEQGFQDEQGSQSEPVSSEPVSSAATLATLSRLVRHLGEELTGFRKRALTAEARVKSLEEQAASGGLSLEKSAELEQDNHELRVRLDEAQQRTTALLERVRFLRQQHESAAIEKTPDRTPEKAEAV